MSEQCDKVSGNPSTNAPCLEPPPKPGTCTPNVKKQAQGNSATINWARKSLLLIEQELGKLRLESENDHEIGEGASADDIDHDHNNNRNRSRSFSGMAGRASEHGGKIPEVVITHCTIYSESDWAALEAGVSVTGNGDTFHLPRVPEIGVAGRFHNIEDAIALALNDEAFKVGFGRYFMVPRFTGPELVFSPEDHLPYHRVEWFKLGPAERLQESCVRTIEEEPGDLYIWFGPYNSTYSHAAKDEDTPHERYKTLIKPHCEDQLMLRWAGGVVWLLWRNEFEQGENKDVGSGMFRRKARGWRDLHAEIWRQYQVDALRWRAATKP